MTSISDFNELTDSSVWESLQIEVNNFFLNLPQNTKEAYLIDLKQFFGFIKQFNVHPYNVTQTHVEEFMNILSKSGGKSLHGKKNPCSDRTFNRKLASITSFYNFLGQKKKISHNPTEFVKRRIMPLRVETNDLTNAKIFELLSLIPDSNYQYSRDKALIATMFYTGLRRAEVVSLKLVNFQSLKDMKYFKVKVKVKGGRIEEIVINKNLEAIISKYLLECRKIGLKDSENEPLFSSLSSPQKHLSGRSVYDIFKKWSNKLNLDYKVSPHSARASFIGALHDMGVSLEDNANSARHKDANMTKAYIKRKKGLEESPVKNLVF